VITETLIETLIVESIELVRQVKRKRNGKERQEYSICWDNIIPGVSIQDERHENFHLSRQTFNYLCNFVDVDERLRSLI
jgi:hypothetical protein